MCIICGYNQVKDVDRALLTGATLTSLSQKYGFTTSALHRHQEHLMQKMAQAQREFHDSLRQGLFCKLNLVMEMVLGVVRGARAGEDFKLFLQASREFTRLISLMLKMDVHLGPGNGLLPYVIPSMGSPGQPLAQCLPDPGRHPPDLESQPFRCLPGTGTRTRPGSSSAPNSRT